MQGGEMQMGINLNGDVNRKIKNKKCENENKY